MAATDVSPPELLGAPGDPSLGRRRQQAREPQRACAALREEEETRVRILAHARFKPRTTRRQGAAMVGVHAPVLASRGLGERKTAQEAGLASAEVPQTSLPLSSPFSFLFVSFLGALFFLRASFPWSGRRQRSERPSRD